MRSDDKHPLRNRVISNSTGELVNCDRVLTKFSSLFSLSLQNYFTFSGVTFKCSSSPSKRGPTHKLTRVSLFRPVAIND